MRRETFLKKAAKSVAHISPEALRLTARDWVVVRDTRLHSEFCDRLRTGLAYLSAPTLCRSSGFMDYGDRDALQDLACSYCFKSFASRHALTIHKRSCINAKKRVADALDGARSSFLGTIKKRRTKGLLDMVSGARNEVS